MHTDGASYWLWIEAGPPGVVGYVCLRPMSQSKCAYLCLPRVFMRELVCRIPAADLRGWTVLAHAVLLSCEGRDGTVNMRTLVTDTPHTVASRISQLYWSHHLHVRGRIGRPDAQTGGVCVVCMDEMRKSTGKIVTLGCCGLSMHLTCAMQWCEMSKGRVARMTNPVPPCPACRSRSVGREGER